MEKRIFYHDTDSGGIVYYANYLKYTEEARTLWMADRGADVKDLAFRDILFVVKGVSLNYRFPARYGDVIWIDTEIKSSGRASLKFSHRISDKITGVLLVECEVVLACVSGVLKPRVIPDDILRGLRGVVRE